MAWLSGESGYDRARILDVARRAGRRGAHAKAIAMYERVRDVEPENSDVLRRLAAQRIRAGQREEALRDCRLAAEKLSKKGFVAEAIGVYREFAGRFADEVTVWHAISELELERMRRPDAVVVLLEGSRHFRTRSRAMDALSLLRAARGIDPFHFEANFALAGLMVRHGAKVPARKILETLVPHARTRRDRRRLRGRLFRLAPAPTTAWRWIVAVFGAE